MWSILTLFYVRGLGIVVLHVMFPQPYGFSFDFQNREGQFNHIRVLFEMMKEMLPNIMGGSLKREDGGSLNGGKMFSN